MFTDLQDSTGMTARLGDAKRNGIVAYTRFSNAKCVENTGREVKHLGDGISASFASIDQSLECAIAIQGSAFAAYNVQNSGAPLHLRIGWERGRAVEHDNDLSVWKNGPIGFRLLHARETGSRSRD
jgi:class 3 adenylate cyclase